jgi:prepilin-type N-terminal cleavage/methylation domain-containing protein
MVTRARRAGYSLVEVMMAVAILGIISTVGATMMLNANRYFILTKTRNDLQKEARAALYVMTRELRQGQANTIIIDRLSNTQPFYSRIRFTTMSGVATTYEQSGNKLIMIQGAHSNTLSTHVQYMAFTFPRSDLLSILGVSMTLQENIFQGRTKALHMASQQVQVMN